jgi:hypothetical protein
MERSTFSEERIIGSLRVQEAGATTAGVCGRPPEQRSSPRYGFRAIRRMEVCPGSEPDQ